MLWGNLGIERERERERERVGEGKGSCYVLEECNHPATWKEMF